MLISTKLNALLDETDDLKRSAAIIVLAELGDASAVTTADVIALLSHRDELMRGAAAAILGELRDAMAVTGLCKALRDADPRVKLYASEALGNIGAPAFAGLRDVFLYGDLDERWWACIPLTKIGDDQSISLLCQQLVQNQSTNLHQIAMTCLRGIGSPAVGAVCALLEKGEPHTIGTASEVLATIGDIRAVEPLCRTIVKLRRASGIRFVKRLLVSDKVSAHNDSILDEFLIRMLMTFGDEAELPRRLICARELSIPQRISSLEIAARIHELRSIGSAAECSRYLLSDSDPNVMSCANEVNAFVSGKHGELLAASQRAPAPRSLTLYGRQVDSAKFWMPHRRCKWGENR